MMKEDAKSLVDKYRAEHAGVGIQDAIDAVGVTKSAYYYAAKKKKAAKKAPQMAKPSYTKVEARKPAPQPAPAAKVDAGKLFLIVGTPEQIRGMLK